MSDYLFGEHHDTGETLQRWWQGLKDNKGDRAELRRCASVLEVVMTPAYQRIFRRLAQRGLPEDDGRPNPRLPVIVALIAQIRDTGAPPTTMRLAEVMSQTAKDSDRPRVSPQRFRNLLALDAPDELLAGFRRVLPLIEGEVKPQVLAHDLYYWGDKVKRNWAYAYRWPDATAE